MFKSHSFLNAHKFTDTLYIVLILLFKKTFKHTFLKILTDTLKTPYWLINIKALSYFKI